MAQYMIKVARSKDGCEHDYKDLLIGLPRSPVIGEAWRTKEEPEITCRVVDFQEVAEDHPALEGIKIDNYNFETEYYGTK